MRQLSLKLAAAALAALFLVACGPPPLTREAAYGAWHGLDSNGKDRIEFTFIDPDRAEIKWLDLQDREVVKGKWEISDGKMKVSAGGKNYLFVLKQTEENGDPRLTFSEVGGKISVTKL